MQIDTVEQGTGQFVAITLLLFGAAAAAVVGVAKVAAGTGVHGCDQLETCGKADLVLGPGNHDLATLQRRNVIYTFVCEKLACPKVMRISDIPRQRRGLATLSNVNWHR